MTARYGQVTALHGVSLSVGEGEAVAVLGANGAGKTTTLRAISGAVRRSGRIAFAGQSIARSSPEATARAGIAHVPEGPGHADRPDRAREPPSRRLHPPRPRGDQGGRGARARLLPAPARAARPARRHAQRRRAADARARPRADAATAPAAARRAVARARAAGGRGDLPDRRRAERARGPGRARRRAERGARARRVRARVRARGRQGRGRGRERGPPARRSGPRSRTSATDAARLRLDAARAADRDRPRLRRRLGDARRRARADLPLDRRRQLRAGRDGDVLDLHRLVARPPRPLVLGRLLPHRRDLVLRRRGDRAGGDQAGRARARADGGDRHARPLLPRQRRRALDLVARGAEPAERLLDAGRSTSPGSPSRSRTSARSPSRWPRSRCSGSSSASRSSASPRARRPSTRRRRGSSACASAGCSRSAGGWPRRWARSPGC